MATIILKHSTVKDKLPSSAQFGEVFVNYHNENPFLATLNNQGQFEKFLSENKTKELFYTKSQVNNIIANLESGGTIEFDDYYKKNEVDTLLQSKSDIGHTHSYTALTDLPDLSIYLTEHQSLDDYLTIASASTIYATKEELEEHIPTVDAYSKEETDALLAGKANSAHTHDYETLTNKPDLSNFATKGEIPDTSSFATKQELEDYQMKSGMTSYLTIAQAEQDLQPKGDYALQSQIPDTSNFITSGFCEDRYQPKGTYVVPSDLNDYALKSDLPTVPDSYTKTETDNLLAGKANSAHTHDYETLTNKPDLSIYLTEHQDISGLATKQELENYMPNSGMTDYALKSEIPSIEGLATEAELANYQSISGMSEYSTTAHTHSYNDLTDKPTIPSTSGLASETWVSNNFAGTGHTHSQYLTQTSADSRYARVVSCTQAEYDALVQSDQVEQGVLYCIIEANS